MISSRPGDLRLAVVSLPPMFCKSRFVLPLAALCLVLIGLAGMASASGRTESIVVAVTGQGHVTSSPRGISCPRVCKKAFRYRTVVHLTANPAAGWTFGKWLGACSRISQPTCSFRLSVPKAIRAVFSRVVPPPAPPPPPPLGSRENPVPIGQTADVGLGWKLVVTQAYPDATGAVLAANEFNTPPAEGQQFFMVAATVTYTGSGSATFLNGVSLKALGASNVVYDDLTNDCGVLPDPDLPLNDPEIFSGGSVSGNAACWSVASPDANSLEMFAEVDSTGQRVFFALH